jgi:hypothetical protein
MAEYPTCVERLIEHPYTAQIAGCESRAVEVKSMRQSFDTPPRSIRRRCIGVMPTAAEHDAKFKTFDGVA